MRSFNYSPRKLSDNIDIKGLAKGYVIGPGSPGYSVVSDLPISKMDEKLRTVIFKPVRADKPRGEFIPSSGDLDTILNHLSVNDFRNNDTWVLFITSAIAAYGDSDSVKESLYQWSTSDPLYTADRTVRTRINSIRQSGGISERTFFYILKTKGLNWQVLHALGVL